MMFRRALIALVAGAALAACASVEAPLPSEGPATITLTRSACYGLCPSYSVTIRDTGDVRYVGEHYVNVIGEQHAVIPRADVQRLLRRFDAMGFDNLRSEYRAEVTDLPTTTITLERDGRTKSVLDYGGRMAGMPDSVGALQDEIDRVANTGRWVLRNGQQVTTRGGQ